MSSWSREALARLARSMRGCSPLEVGVRVAALTVIVAIIDYATGYEIGFSLFYLAPISLAAWFGGSHMGMVAAILAATIWGILDRAAGHQLPVAVHVWNAGLRLGFFSLTSGLLASLHRAFVQLEELARTDALTGLPNRRAFVETLAHELRRQLRTRARLSIVYFDLDGFKAVNDRLGHAEGDRVLRAVAMATRDALREGDVAARIGGDEFAALLPETAGHQAADLVEAMRSSVRRAMQQGGWDTDLSIGVVTLADGAVAPERALRLADELALEAKQSGKGRVAYAAFSAPQRVATTAALSAASSDQKM